MDFTDPCGAGAGPVSPAPGVRDRSGHGASSESGGAAQMSCLSRCLHWTSDATVWTLLLQVWEMDRTQPSCPYLSFPHVSRPHLSSPVQVLCTLHDDGPAWSAAVSCVSLLCRRRQSSSQRQLGSNHWGSAGKNSWDQFTFQTACEYRSKEFRIKKTSSNVNKTSNFTNILSSHHLLHSDRRWVFQVELSRSCALSITTRSAFTARRRGRWSVASVEASVITEDTKSHLWAPSTATWR